MLSLQLLTRASAHGAALQRSAVLCEEHCCEHFRQEAISWKWAAVREKTPASWQSADSICFLTDPSPAMVAQAKAKLAPLGGRAEVAAGEELEDFAARHLAAGGARFDGAFSNFAPLNCVADLGPVARGLATLLKPGAAAMLVLFGTLCPGEMVVETLRGRPHLALRRCKRGACSREACETRVPCRLSPPRRDGACFRSRGLCWRSGLALE